MSKSGANFFTDFGLVSMIHVVIESVCVHQCDCFVEEESTP